MDKMEYYELNINYDLHIILKIINKYNAEIISVGYNKNGTSQHIVYRSAKQIYYCDLKV
jgi:hypothetical protein